MIEQRENPHIPDYGNCTEQPDAPTAPARIVKFDAI
jgi:hypothetical protein